MRRYRLLTFLTVGVLALGLLLSGCGGSKKIDVIKIGSHTWNEPALIMEMVALLIQAEMPGQKVEHVRNLASSEVLQTAVDQGDLHIYPTWTGTLWTGPLRQNVTEDLRKDPKKLFDETRRLSKEKLKVLISDSLGFEDTYALVMRRQQAEELGIKTVSDLANHAQNLTIATDQDFQARDGDGFDALREWYGGIEFKGAAAMEVDLMYRAVAASEADVAVAYSTDGRIKQLDLVVLQDDKHFFPAYDTILVISPKLYEANPKLEGIVNQLLGKISVEEMIEMNYLADVEGKDVTELARDFLVKEGLIKQ